MKLRGLFIAAAMLLMPTAALAAPGIVTTTVSLKAGPGEGFPTVDRIPGGTRVNIHGCFRGKAWCDVSWSDDRGWVSSKYLQYLYRNRYVYLPDYVDEIDVPIVPFALTTYWSSHYAGRPWYHRRAHWSGYWQSHEHVATRLTIDRSAARIGRAAAARDAALPEARTRVGVEERSRARVDERTRAGTEERTRAGVTERGRAGVTERVTRERDIATRGAREGRERAVVQDRMTREDARRARESARTTREDARATVRERGAVREQPTARTRTQTPPVMARGHDEPRAAAPRSERAAPRMTQPDAARGGGGQPNVRAQQTPAPAAPRAAAPATPQGGGAPQAAPRGGGGPGGGGGGHGQDKRQ
ncbi:SH3 domain-containing protein [Bradyrhizobium algeriense]|uniref:SH3 domain-containing protein n=1 Tax=Bradyrhizobium algeriense TaxID=634784 RepID=UPI000D3D0DA9|nr:SH3 domain-containing protein [Bradyrhizobium algeriense]